MESGLVFSERFKIIGLSGKGSFGEIYHGIDLETGNDVAIKLEPISSKMPQLEREYNVYRVLAGGCGIPQVYHCTKEGDFNIMVMDLLGPSLEDLFNCCNRVFSLKTVLMLAIQMLHRLEFVHSNRFITRDVKPENFLIGRGEHSNTIFMIDYGLAKKFMDSNMQHVPYTDGKSLTGTVRYASINMHLGITPTRRDDLESLGYMLIYFLRGKLPWQGVQATNKDLKYQKIAQNKITSSVQMLSEGFPPEFRIFLEYSRSLKFEDAPDYQYLRKLFLDLFYENYFVLDFDWDWLSFRIDASFPVEVKAKNKILEQSDPWLNKESIILEEEPANEGHWISDDVGDKTNNSINHDDLANSTNNILGIFSAKKNHNNNTYSNNNQDNYYDNANVNFHNNSAYQKKSPISSYNNKNYNYNNSNNYNNFNYNRNNYHNSQNNYNYNNNPYYNSNNSNYSNKANNYDPNSYHYRPYNNRNAKKFEYREKKDF